MRDILIPRLATEPTNAITQGDTMSVQDLLTRLQPVSGKAHYTWCCKPLAYTPIEECGKMIYGSWTAGIANNAYTTVSNPWVILRPDGHLDAVSGAFIDSYYTGAEDIEFSARKLDYQGKYADWIKLKAKPYDKEVKLYAAQIPLNVTALFGGALRVNTSMAAHGQGDFVVVPKGPNGEYNTRAVYVMTPAEFANRFNLAGWGSKIPTADRVELKQPKERFFSVAETSLNIQDAVNRVVTRWCGPSTVLKVPSECKSILVKMEAAFRCHCGAPKLGIAEYIQGQGKLMEAVFSTLKETNSLTCMGKIQSNSASARTEETLSSCVRNADWDIMYRYAIRLTYMLLGQKGVLCVHNILALTERGTIRDTWILEWHGEEQVLSEGQDYLTVPSETLCTALKKTSAPEREVIMQKAKQYMCDNIRKCMQKHTVMVTLLDTAFEPMPFKRPAQNKKDTVKSGNRKGK